MQTNRIDLLTTQHYLDLQKTVNSRGEFVKHYPGIQGVKTIRRRVGGNYTALLYEDLVSSVASSFLGVVAAGSSSATGVCE